MRENATPLRGETSPRFAERSFSATRKYTPHASGLVPFALASLGSRGVLEAPRREPVCLAADAVVHVRVVVTHAPVVRVGTAIGRGRPPVAVVTDTAEQTAVVVASGQSGKAIVIRVCDTRIRCPQGTYRFQFVACRSSSHIGLQSIPRRGVWQVPARGANRQRGWVVVEATVGGAVAGHVAVTPGVPCCGRVVQVLGHPSLRANHHGLVRLLGAGECIGRSIIGTGL